MEEKTTKKVEDITLLRDIWTDKRIPKGTRIPDLDKKAALGLIKSGKAIRTDDLD